MPSQSSNPKINNECGDELKHTMYREVSVAPFKVSIEAFYNKFWAAGKYGSAATNDDECARAGAIVAALHYCGILPHVSGNRTVLDVGCGRGWLTALLSDFGCVVGIDPVSAGPIRARELFPKIDFRIADTDTLIKEGGAATFDIVVSSEVIEHIHSAAQNRFFQDLFTLLKPGGCAVLTTPRGELWEWYKAHGNGFQPVEAWIFENDLQEMARTAGFQVLVQRRIFVGGYPYCTPARLLGVRHWRQCVRVLSRLSLIRRVVDHFGIYQILGLKRPGNRGDTI